MDIQSQLWEWNKSKLGKHYGIVKKTCGRMPEDRKSLSPARLLFLWKNHPIYSNHKWSGSCFMPELGKLNESCPKTSVLDSKHLYSLLLEYQRWHCINGREALQKKVVQGCCREKSKINTRPAMFYTSITITYCLLNIQLIKTSNCIWQRKPETGPRREAMGALPFHTI